MPNSKKVKEPLDRLMERSNLSEAEKSIMRMRQIAQASSMKLASEEIGRKLGISADDVRRKETEAISKLCDEIDNELHRIESARKELDATEHLLHEVDTWLLRRVMPKGENTDVTDLNLCTRTVNSLKIARIRTLGDLVKRTEKEIMNTPGMGCKGVEELNSRLADHGLSLRRNGDIGNA